MTLGETAGDMWGETECDTLGETGGGMLGETAGDMWGETECDMLGETGDILSEN